jgi:hypothetical protein
MSTSSDRASSVPDYLIVDFGRRARFPLAVCFITDRLPLRPAFWRHSIEARSTLRTDAHGSIDGIRGDVVTQEFREHCHRLMGPGDEIFVANKVALALSPQVSVQASDRWYSRKRKSGEAWTIWATD